MNRDGYIITTRLTQSHLADLEAWIQFESADRTPSAFYLEAGAVTKALEENRLICALQADEPVAFLTWSDVTGLIARVEFVAVKRSKRRLGIAGMLVDSICDALRGHKFQIADLYCAPLSNRAVWERCGFLDAIQSSRRGRMYRPLVACLQPSDYGQERHKFRLELWTRDYCKRQFDEPSFVWSFNINEETKKLDIPIICPAKGDWDVRLTDSSGRMREMKVKYFVKEQFIDDFLIVNRI